MINGVVLRKLNTLDEILMELRSLGTVSVSQLENDWRTRRAIERDLQLAVEVLIDVCQRLISIEGQTPATTGAEAIERCIKLGIIAEFEPYRKMVQFRNFVVHRYERVEVAFLVDIVNGRLGDFERFRDEVLSHEAN